MLEAPRRILVIDDEAPVRVIAERMLQHFGYEVYAAEDGQSGLALIREHNGAICLVLVDLAMPTMGGELIAQLIKAQWPQIPVMLMSGYGAFELNALVPRLGVEGVLQKPFTLASLRVALDQVLSTEY